MLYPHKRSFPLLGLTPSVPVPRLALYVYEYLLHVGAQKSAQTFLSEIRWEKNITLGEPPGFLHSWWCVFWDLYCAAPERRETCEHSSEAKAFHDYSAAAAPSPVLGNIPPGDGMPVGPVPPGFFQGPPGSQPSPHAQPLPHNSSHPMMGPHTQVILTTDSGGAVARHMLHTGHPNMGGAIQRMTPPRGMVPLGPQVRDWLGGTSHQSVNQSINQRFIYQMHNNIVYSSGSLTPMMTSLSDSTNSGDNMYTMINAVPPGGNRPNFPMGPGADGPMAGIAGMESHHMNGSLGSADMDSISKNSPGNISMSNQPGTPRDDSEMGGTFLNPFQNESYSPNMTMSV
uniref:Single stranded DNA binding protein 2a n=1 Tax=Scleropages formosus TaxID=113540 RepID=A0A8C9VMA6_SCLFO